MIDDDLADRSRGYVPMVLAAAVVVSLAVLVALRILSQSPPEEPLIPAGSSFVPDEAGGGLVLAEPIGEIVPEFPEGIGGSMFEGNVMVGTTVGPDGEVVEVEVVRSFEPALDAIARKTVRKLTFRPATRDGKPVACKVLVAVPFKAF